MQRYKIHFRSPFILYVYRSVPSVENLPQFERELLVSEGGKVGRYVHRGCSDVTGHTAHGIGIPTEGDGAYNSIFEGLCFEETDDGLWHSLITDGLKSV